ncbi:RNA polymerase sigma factor [Mucilaginibacter aquatilis]|uniref:Sigma-70 family RNA polymerase sigma factor n=1 Tax=Mucilaginibacter aquatilis TaxID=1517760 RepID=A0A6I4IAU6_9SPHI|nr:sigma-70 family RNA polymerase sigma factor [Mucilaginibacter aquatilis]MVN92222.1 sigma-70 family RNA polymerase sigma factor [Mucilaginibacter aquatilis]
MSWFSKNIKPDTVDDDALLQRYRQTGDLSVLGQLYQQYMPLVYGVCLKYLQDEEQSKDAVMQIFEELITKIHKHDVKQFRSWLFVLSRNFCLMQLRANKKNQTLSIDEVMEFPFVLHHNDDDDAMDNEAGIQQLEKCMQQLSPQQKQSVDLFYIKEKCYKEVADITGYTLNEVKSYIQNGKRNLKICLENSREQ